MPKSGATASGGFDFQKQPESYLELLDYLQHALHQTWEDLSRFGGPPSRKPFSKEALLQWRVLSAFDLKKPWSKGELELQQSQIAYNNYVCERYRKFVDAFLQVSHPLKLLFEMPRLTLPTTKRPEFIFFDFTQNPIENTSSRKITEHYDLFWGNLCSKVHKVAVDCGELPESWSPGQAAVRVYENNVEYMERYPAFPIRSQEDLSKWLLLLSKRILKPDRPAQSQFATVSTVKDLSEEDCYCPGVDDISRELLNCRRSLVNWGIFECPNWEDVPPDLRAAENRVLTVIEWLKERHKPKSPGGEPKVKTRPNKHDKTRDQRNRFSCPRRAKDPPETWQEIHEAYSEKYPLDTKASPGTLRQSHDRNCQQCAADRVR